MFDKVQSTEKQEEFTTGSVRGDQSGKPRLDLIPTLWLKRMGNHLANGARVYGDNNWQKGQPLSRYYGSALRHTMAWYDGDESEDHYAAAAWNNLAAMWTLEQIRAGKLPAELDDRPNTTDHRAKEEALQSLLKSSEPMVKSLRSWV